MISIKKITIILILFILFGSRMNVYATQSQDPGQTGPDSDDFVNRVFDVDFGTGSWTIPGYDEPVTAWLKGKQAEGVRVAESAYVIKLENFDSDAMKAFVYADDGFTVELIPTEDNEVSLWHYEPSHFVLPRSLLHFGVEKKNADGPGSDDSGNKVYSIDFGDGSWTVPGYDKPITASIKGSQAKGVQDMESLTVIRLEGFDENVMKASVYTDDGFTVELVPDGGNIVSLERYSPSYYVLPDSLLHFKIDKNKESTSETAPGYSAVTEEVTKNTEAGNNTEQAVEQSKSDSGLPVAAIIAIIAGAVLLLIIIVVIISKKKRSVTSHDF